MPHAARSLDERYRRGSPRYREASKCQPMLHPCASPGLISNRATALRSLSSPYFIHRLCITTRYRPAMSRSFVTGLMNNRRYRRHAWQLRLATEREER